MFSIHSTAQRRWFRRVHVTFPGAIIEKNSGLQLCHPRIVPILSGAISGIWSNITITGNEMLRGGFSGFEGKEAGRRRYMFFCFGPTVLSRCVFSPCVPYCRGAYIFNCGLVVANVGSALTNNKHLIKDVHLPIFMEASKTLSRGKYRNMFPLYMWCCVRPSAVMWSKPVL